MLIFFEVVITFWLYSKFAHVIGFRFQEMIFTLESFGTSKEALILLT